MTTTSPPVDFHTHFKKANQAFRRGDNTAARHWARQAAETAPDREEVWLLLAALASPRGSVAYLKRALEINPNSQRARKGMHWAVNRMRKTSEKPVKPRRIRVDYPRSTQDLTLTRRLTSPWLLLLLILSLGLAGWTWVPSLTQALTPQKNASSALSAIERATFTPTPTNTPTPTPTFTPTPTNTPTPTPTNTPTNTPTPTETPTPVPTATFIPLPTNTPYVPQVPEDTGSGEAWIDVNLSNQTTSAYRGNQLVATFIVSTGTWQHPTVTGQYRIYVKYRYADMSGPGYYLPDVPYVMYFYKGYGIHGTYWHNNFGVPMSHGCINLRTEDAGWMFNFASVGTLVNIHY